MPGCGKKLPESLDGLLANWKMVGRARENLSVRLMVVMKAPGFHSGLSPMR